MVNMSNRASLLQSKQSGKNERPSRVRCIVTGFNTFGSNTGNPSELVARALPDHVKVPGFEAPIVLQNVVLPTCCNGAWDLLQPILADTRYAQTILIMLGQGLTTPRARPNLERVALNIRHYRIQDNYGHTYDEEEIQPGPLALKTEFPLPALVEHLKKLGLPAKTSHHAGTFVCNDLYYRCLAYQTEHGNPALTFFMHIPKVDAYASTIKTEGGRKMKNLITGPGSRARRLELLTTVVMEAIKFSAAELLQAGYMSRVNAQARFNAAVKNLPSMEITGVHPKPAAKASASSTGADTADGAQKH
jgi:pyroglutamyl-peptidase